MAEPGEGSSAGWRPPNGDDEPIVPGRLIAGDEASWERVLALIARTVVTATRSWDLSTLASDSVRDYALDVLLVGDMSRLRGIREPAKLNAYLIKILWNRVRFVASRRPKTVVHAIRESGENTLRPVADVRPAAEFSAFAGRSAKAHPALASTLLHRRSVLSDRQFRVLWLFHVERISMRRVAKAIGVTRQAVARTHGRALGAIDRARLRVEEEPWGDS